MDLEKAQKEFIKYTENYDLRDSNIIRKQLHSIRVMELSEKIAKRLKLSKEKGEFTLGITVLIV